MFFFFILIYFCLAHGHKLLHNSFLASDDFYRLRITFPNRFSKLMRGSRKFCQRGSNSEVFLFLVDEGREDLSNT